MAIDHKKLRELSRQISRQAEAQGLGAVIDDKGVLRLSNPLDPAESWGWLDLPVLLGNLPSLERLFQTRDALPPAVRAVILEDNPGPYGLRFDIGRETVLSTELVFDTIDAAQAAAEGVLKLNARAMKEVSPTLTLEKARDFTHAVVFNDKRTLFHCRRQ